MLKDSSPSVFMIASEKETSVPDLMGIASDLGQWNVSFTRKTQRWEAANFELLRSSLDYYTPFI